MGKSSESVNSSPKLPRVPPEEVGVQTKKAISLVEQQGVLGKFDIPNKTAANEVRPHLRVQAHLQAQSPSALLFGNSTKESVGSQVPSLPNQAIEDPRSTNPFPTYEEMAQDVERTRNETISTLSRMNKAELLKLVDQPDFEWEPDIQLVTEELWTRPDLTFQEKFRVLNRFAKVVTFAMDELDLFSEGCLDSMVHIARVEDNFFCARSSPLFPAMQKD